MNIILLERVAKLGQMGETVRVRDGYARNFLLPQGKALRATEENKKRFERERSQLEALNLEARREAETVHGTLGGQSFVLVRQAGEAGQLYGSVSTRDIADALKQGGFTVGRNQVELNKPIKTIGLHRIEIALHPEVETTITVNVARSNDEAERQARGEDMTARDRDEGLDDQEIEELFDETPEEFADGETPEADEESAAADEPDEDEARG